jgi:ABC-2 type transport system permease protein
MIFPVVIVFILGNMLQSLDNADQPIEKIKLAYVIETENPMDIQAINQFIKAVDENASVKLTKSDDFAASKAAVDDDKLDAAVCFKEPFAITVAEGSDLTKNRAVKLTMQSFAREYASIGVLATHTGVIAAPPTGVIAASEPQSSYEGQALDPGSEPGMTNFEPGMTSFEPGMTLSEEPPMANYVLSIDKDLGVNRSMIDYYAVMMILMIAFMAGSSTGAVTIWQGRQDGTMRRVMLSPVSRSKYFVHTLLGMIPQNLLQVAAIMIPSVLIYNAHYASTWQQNLLLFFGFTVIGLAVAAVCMIFGIFMKINPFIPFMAVVWVLLFLSGTFSKEIFITGFSEYLPTSMIREAAFDLTVFGRPEQMLIVTAISAAIIVISAIIGSLLFKKKELFV